MKRLTFILILLASVFGASAQDGHIKYKEQGNTHFYGRTVLFRSDAANLDTLTSVYSGQVAYDSTERVVKVYDGAEWQGLTYGTTQDTTITIATAAVLTLNATPVTIVAAPGSGKAIEVVSASVKLDFNSAAYATVNTVILETSGATERQFDVDILDATVSTVRKMIAIHASGATDTQLIDNAALTVKAKTSNPTTGDSDIKVYLRYRIIDL